MRAGTTGLRPRCGAPHRSASQTRADHRRDRWSSAGCRRWRLRGAQTARRQGVPLRGPVRSPRLAGVPAPRRAGLTSGHAELDDQAGPGGTGGCSVEVGDTGLEPVTSSVSRKRATRLRQSPVCSCVPRPRPSDLVRSAEGPSRPGRESNPRTGICSPLPKPLGHPADAEGTGAAPAGASSSGRRDSNPRPSPWQGDALPLSHVRVHLRSGERVVPGGNLAGRAAEGEAGQAPGSAQSSRASSASTSTWSLSAPVGTAS